jgi:TRAP-type uncharacterized transport system fused permease subunit
MKKVGYPPHYAARKGLVGMAQDKLPSARDVTKRGWPFLSAMFILFLGLLYMR